MTVEVPERQTLVEQGRRVRRLMAEAGLGNRVVAAKLEVDESTVSRWRSGKQRIREEHALRLALLLDADPDYIQGAGPDVRRREGEPGVLGLRPGWMAEILMDTDKATPGNRRTTEAVIEASRARGVWTDADEAAWRTFRRMKPAPETPDAQFESLAEAPSDAIQAIGYLDDQIARRREEGAENPIQLAFGATDEWVAAERSSGSFDEASTHYWRAFREGAIRAEAYRPDGHDPVSERIAVDHTA